MTSSTSQQPDLDWSQVRETIRMMNLAVAQIEVSMKEGDDSIDTLTEAFTSMMATVKNIEQTVKGNDRFDSDAQQIVDQCEAISSEMQHTIIAFQFYDKLTQRLSHVSHTLGSLADLVGDSSRLYKPMEWSKLQEQIKSKYTMPAEHLMFEKIMQGMTVEEILRLPPDDSSDEDDIELF